jgi:hypothetical protein
MTTDMKKIFLTILVSAPLMFGSCSDFLDENPQSDITSNSSSASSDTTYAYTSADEATSALSGAYGNYKTDIYELLNYVVGDIMSDNCYAGSDGAYDMDYDNLTIQPTNENIKNSWAEYYTLAGSATEVIEKTKNMASGLISDSERNRIISEAKFIRAWAYFDIVRLWGDAPMTLQLIPTITAENLSKWYPVMYPARTSASDIYAQILDDLSDSNIANLISASHGMFQATKGAAYGLKAKVLATMGSKSSRDYSAVVSYCDKVINEGYKLVPNFDDLWTVEGKQSSEGIFELYFDSTNGNWAYWVLLSDVSGDVQVSWRRYCCPTQDIIKKFDKEKDSRYASSIIWHAVPYNQYYSASNYPLAYKIRQKDNDIILLRLADIMLLKAEALVELNRSSEAIDIVNTVRERAGVDDLNTGMSQSDARLAVENERQLELFLEGQRWFDLVRNGRMETVMQKAHDKNGNILFPTVDSHLELLPIPQGQIDINTNLTQNPGY